MLRAFTLRAHVMQGFCILQSAQPTLSYHCRAAMDYTQGFPAMQGERFRPGRVPKSLLQAARMSCEAFQVPRVRVAAQT